LLCLTLSGCATFVDGVAAVSGRGGEIARADAMPMTRSLAQELAPQQPKPVWQQILPQEAADFAVFIDSERLLVGTVESGSYLGVPDYKEIILYDTKAGQEVWRAGRPKIRNGFYYVLTTEPLLVLEGKTENSSFLLGYDIKTGQRLWEQQRQHLFKSFVEENSLLVAAYVLGEWTVERLSLENGTPIWSQKVATAKGDDNPYKVFLSNRDLLLVSKEVHKLDFGSGASGWSARLPWDNFKILNIYRLSDGYLVSGVEGLALYGDATGELIWSYASEKHPVRLTSLSDGDLYILRTSGALLKGSLLGTEGRSDIECINLKKRKRAWLFALGKEIVSPLVHEGSTLFFTTTDQFVALDAGNGRKLFERKLDKDIVVASPAYAKYLGQPDILRVEGDKIFLARERYGILAFSLPDGKFLWQQPHYLSTLDNFYTANSQYTVFIESLKKYGHLGKDATVGSVPGGMVEYRRSAILQSMQASADNAIARADATRMNPKTSRLGKELASKSKIAAIDSQIIATRMEQSRQAMQAATDLLNAVIDFNAALAGALKQAAEQGLFERLQMQSRGCLAARQGAFLGHYYLWPFRERGRGVTLVDLNTGNRDDLIYAPMVLPVTDFSIDMPTFALSPGQDKLIAFGIPLDQRTYQEYVKWKWLMPRPATLAYDVASLPFNRESQTLKYWEENLKTDLVEWAYRGNAAKVRELIANGVNVNQRKYGVTPLITAIINKHEEVVRLLVANHADVNMENETGAKPLAVAKAVNAPESILNLLVQAGAE